MPRMDRLIRNLIRIGILLSKKRKKEGNLLKEEAQNLLHELEASKRDVLTKFLDAMRLEQDDFGRKAYLGGLEAVIREGFLCGTFPRQRIMLVFYKNRMRRVLVHIGAFHCADRMGSVELQKSFFEFRFKAVPLFFSFG